MANLVTGVNASVPTQFPFPGLVLANSSHLYSSGETCPWLEVAGSECTNPWEEEAAASQDTLEYLGYNSSSTVSCGTGLRWDLSHSTSAYLAALLYSDSPLTQFLLKGFPQEITCMRIPIPGSAFKPVRRLTFLSRIFFPCQHPRARVLAVYGAAPSHFFVTSNPFRRGSKVAKSPFPLLSASWWGCKSGGLT